MRLILAALLLASTNSFADWYSDKIDDGVLYVNSDYSSKISTLQIKRLFSDTFRRSSKKIKVTVVLRGKYEAEEIRNLLSEQGFKDASLSNGRVKVVLENYESIEKLTDGLDQFDAFSPKKFMLELNAVLEIYLSYDELCTRERNLQIANGMASFHYALPSFILMRGMSRGAQPIPQVNAQEGEGDRAGSREGNDDELH